MVGNFRADQTVPESFNFASLIEAIADRAPDRVAVAASDGEHYATYTYRDLDEHGNRFAHVLSGLGISHGDRVAVIAHNRAEWFDIMVGCFKIGALFANVNYRYTSAEIAHVLRDSQAGLVVAEAAFADVTRAAITEAGTTPHVLYLDSDAPAAASYSAHLAAASAARKTWPHPGPHEYLLYTGGTTGTPKGVVWTQDNLVNGAIAYGWADGSGVGFTDPEAVVHMLSQDVPVVMAVAPMMHGNGQWATFRGWVLGGTSAVWTGRSYNAERLLDALERLGVNVVTLVGDAMGKPFVAALDQYPNRWDLSKLGAVGSGGAVMSASTKSAIREHLPGITVIDGYGGSEFGAAVTYVGSDDGSFPKFTVSERIQIVNEDLTPVRSGQEGLVAVGGPVGDRYWNDPDKTATTFRVDATGKRWVVGGDRGFLNDDGTFTLMGRGSLAINTGGEKVFPDEVETVLKDHPAVVDALAVGAPDSVYGSVVAAVVSLDAGATLTLDELQRHARTALAGYKIPRHLVIAEHIRRSPAGKADYTWARSLLARDRATPSAT